MFDIEHVYFAESISDAIALLQENEDSVLISGGTDVLIKIREKKLQNKTLVDISRIPGLSGISLTKEGDICIKAATVFSQIAESRIITENIPMLATAADTVGGPQIRNVATIGGNICNGATSADSSASLMALEAKLRFCGPAGIKERSILKFFLGPGKVAMERTELLTDIIIPRTSFLGWHGHYTKYAMRKAMDIATIGCSVNIKLADSRESIDDARIAYSVAAPTPIRCFATEDKLRAAALADVSRIICENLEHDIKPRTSWRASREFRIHIAKEIGIRTTNTAIISAGGGSIYDVGD